MQRELLQLIKDLISPEKRLWRFYAIFFMAVLLMFNWNKLYWIFNQRAVSAIIESKLVNNVDGEVSDSLPNNLPKAEVAIGDASQNIATIVPTEKPKTVVSPEKTATNTIYIPALNSRAPILKSTVATNAAYLVVLKKGVLHYSDSANPGELGATIILGHSAPANWPDINYDDIFSAISSLKTGDEIRVIYEGKSYIYRTVEGQVIDKGGDIPEKWLTKDAQRIILISCWPPGKDYKRYGVIGELLTD
ncbi:MAG: class E sortase [bacterium]